MTKIPPPKELRHICGDIAPEDRHWREVAARWISIRITWLLLKVFPGIMPNPVTVLMLVVGFLSVFFFMIGSYLAVIFGVILYQLYLILDACDGEIARYRKVGAEYGMKGIYLDYLGHILLNPLIIFAIAVGAYRHNWLLTFIPSYWFLIIGFVTFYCMTINNFLKLKKFEMFIEKKDFKKIQEMQKVVKAQYVHKSWFKQETQFFFRIMTFNSIFFFGIFNLMSVLVLLNGVIYPLQMLKRFYSEVKSA